MQLAHPDGSAASTACQSASTAASDAASTVAALGFNIFATHSAAQELKTTILHVICILVPSDITNIC